MTALSHRRLNTLNASLLRLYEPCSFNEFAPRVFETVERLLPDELVCVSALNPRTRAFQTLINHPAAINLIAADYEYVTNHLLNLPGYTDSYAVSEAPSSYHERIGTAAVKSEPYYQMIYRPLGLLYEMSFNFHTDRLAYFVTTIRGPKKYSAEERNILSLLQPHLKQRFQQLRANEPGHPIFSPGNAPNDICWLLCSHSGKIVRLSAEAQTMLAHHGIFLRGTIPHLWKEWIRLQLTPTAGRAPQPLLLKTKQGRLVIHCLPENGQHHLVLQALPNSPLKAELTPRQREIAHWLAEGKTNAEIAAIFEISSATVKNHVEQILAKLGVENRTSAAIAIKKLSY